MNLDQVHRLMASDGMLLEVGETVQCYECWRREFGESKVNLNPVGMMQMPSVCRTCGRRGPAVMRLTRSVGR